jgi:hypothetical protein
MIQEFTRHITHYLSLIGLIGLGLVGLLAFHYDKVFQSAVAIGIGAGFVVWGIVHHHVYDNLHHKIVLEYIATALLGVTILLSVIWTA